MGGNGRRAGLKGNARIAARLRKKLLMRLEKVAETMREILLDGAIENAA